MRGIEIEKCENQGHFFEAMSEKGYDYEMFLSCYASSRLAERCDSSHITDDQINTANEKEEWLLIEYPKLKKTHEDSFGYAYELGYLLRMVSIKTDMGTKELYDKGAVDMILSLLKQEYEDFQHLSDMVVKKLRS